MTTRMREALIPMILVGCAAGLGRPAHAPTAVSFGAKVTQATNPATPPPGYIPIHVGDGISGSFAFDQTLTRTTSTATTATYVYSQKPNTHAIQFVTSPVGG